MLKNMYSMYIHYGNNVNDPEQRIYTKNPYDENGNYVERGYTKDEFYEAMRRMIVYGPTNYEYRDSAPNYSQMTGEFRVRFSELFISEERYAEIKEKYGIPQIGDILMTAVGTIGRFWTVETEAPLKSSNVT